MKTLRHFLDFILTKALQAAFMVLVLVYLYAKLSAGWPF